MLRLFGIAGLLTVICAAAAAASSWLFFRVATVLLGGGMVLLYWWLHRSLPPRSGHLQVTGLRDPVEIYRDERGVPHIFARNLHDLFYAQGFVTAQDRLWSMHLARRAALGTLSELFGPRFLPYDRHLRTVGLRRTAEESLKKGSPQFAALLEAYAAGVNAHIAQKRLPLEFSLLRHKPEPWSAIDTLAIAAHTGYLTGSTWTAQFFRAALIQAVGSEKAAELFPGDADRVRLQLLEDLDLPDTAELLSAVAQEIHEGVGGSGAAVAGARSRTGSPLLVSDATLPISAALTWYEAHLVGPEGFEVSGATLPGLPCVVMGQTRDLAWSVSGQEPVGDAVFVERLNPDAPEEYEADGVREVATFIREEIRVRGESAPVVHRVMVTRHGPVLARNDRTALAVRFGDQDPCADLESLLAINRSSSWTEFRKATTGLCRPLTFVVACRDGTVGSHDAGTFSHRNVNQVPGPGWINGWEPVPPRPAARPDLVNPPEGYVVSGPGDAVGRYRSARLETRLSGGGSLAVGNLQQLFSDLVNPQAASLLQLLLNAVQEGLRQGNQPEVLNDLEKKALLMLSGWECEESPGSPAAILWHQWYLFMVEGIFRPQMGLQLFDQFVSCGNLSEVADRLVRRSAKGGTSLWLAAEGERSLSRVALRAFRRAVALVAAKQGRLPERWRWDREHRITFGHPLTLPFPWLRWFLNVGPLPVGGSSTTLTAHGYSRLLPFTVTVASLWRQVVDLGSVNEARSICAPGQSGHVAGAHQADQVPAWIKGDLLPRLLRHDTIRALPRLQLQPERRI